MALGTDIEDEVADLLRLLCNKDLKDLLNAGQGGSEQLE